MTNDQYCDIKWRFPNPPQTAEEHARLHDALYALDSNLVHLSGCGFVSVIYPNGEVFVFKTPDDDGTTFNFR